MARVVVMEKGSDRRREMRRTYGNSGGGIRVVVVFCW